MDDHERDETRDDGMPPDDERNPSAAGDGQDDARSVAEDDGASADAADGRIPAHPPTPQGYGSEGRQRVILMTPHMAAIGGLLAFFTVVLMVVVLPTATYTPSPSDNWLPLSNTAVEGRQVFIANGCMYCHSGFSRPQDVAAGGYYLYPRAAEPGDYYGVDQSPNLLGSERTGPDLSQEGGNHPDEWHLAHYNNPRNVTPLSIMPRFNFWTQRQLNAAIAFNQESGGKQAILRSATETVGNKLMRINQGKLDPADAFPELVQQLQQQGIYNAAGKPTDPSPWGLPWMAVWMMNTFERGYWLTPDPLPVTAQNLLRGQEIFMQRCAACHGARGDGNGPAAQYFNIKPFDFTDKSAMGMSGPFASEGQQYHRILTAGKGTAMENFGTRLSVEDIWRVVLFVRTIPNGSLATPNTVPTVAMFQRWTPPPPMLRYIQDHPIEAGPGDIVEATTDPFAAAGHWLSPGLGATDMVMDGGKLPITPDRLTALIRTTYFQMVERAYDDALGRGEKLPPKEQIMDTTGLEFHAP
ncbi:MAG: cbb3-type cytochrome c oxidase subunit II [Chloroflexota bacterium]|nr:cbb3-type cytochrome c oxidase subunit II [Chloroflexota bacterium]